MTGFDADEIAKLLPRDGINVVPPTAFNEYDDDLETTFRCPKCSYEWSGKPK
jgi:predicted Zn-ribbon and HTH transcriptional regulator